MSIKRLDRRQEVVVFGSSDLRVVGKEEDDLSSFSQCFIMVTYFFFFFLIFSFSLFSVTLLIAYAFLPIFCTRERRTQSSFFFFKDGDDGNIRPGD